MGSMFFHKERGRSFGFKYWMISILSNKGEMTGAMLMETMGQMSGGQVRPSPGSVYPLLNDLAENGYLKTKTRDNMKYYSLTEKSREFLNTNWISKWWMMNNESPAKSLSYTIETMGNCADYLLRNKASLYSDKKLRGKFRDVAKKINSIG